MNGRRRHEPTGPTRSAASPPRPRSAAQALGRRRPPARWVVATAAVLVALGGAAWAQPPAALPFVLKQIGPGVYAAIDGPERKAGSNAELVIGDDGVLVIDSFSNTDAATALLAEIRRITTKPVRYLVNTHYHVDHTGGDAVMREAGAVVIAHRNVRGWIRTENFHLFGDRLTPELKTMVETLPLPDLVTDKDLTIWLGSRKVVVQSVLGHTGGDLTVAVPDAHALFCGDLLWTRRPPNLVDGSVREWAATDGAFLERPDAAATAYVPGHGDVADRRDITDFRAFPARPAAVGGRQAARPALGDALAQDVAPKLRALHSDWTITDRAAASVVRYIDQELAGTNAVQPRSRTEPSDDASIRRGR